MNNFDDWSQIISKYLKSEADPLGTLTKHEMEDDAARTAFVHSVLDRFLPEIYGVGSGQIMDSKGKLSGKMDIIIYRRDFPRLDLPGSRNIYLYESVIATVEVVAKLVKKTLSDALGKCASLAELNPDIDHKVMTGLAAKSQLTLNENRQYIHPDPVRTARFHLIGRPISFIYAFSGYKTSPKQLADSMQAWIDERHKNYRLVEMKELPAVVATPGCFAWRNSAPFKVNDHSLMGVGVDQAPVRLIVLQMLYMLSRRLKVTTDGNGLRPGLDAYLKRMPSPKVELFIGRARNPAVGRESVKARMNQDENPVTKTVGKPVAAKTPVPKPTVKKPIVSKQAEAPVAAKATLASKPEVKKSAAVSKPIAESAQSSAEVKQKPAVDSAPKPKPEVEIKTRPSLPSTTIDNTATPTPVKRSTAKTIGNLNPKPKAVDAPFPIPNADLIPKLDPNPPGSEGIEDDAVNAAFGKPEGPVVTNQAEVDNKPTAGSVTEKQSQPVAAVDSADNFLETVKLQMAMPEQVKKSNGSLSNSAEDFMETVKLNIASPEPIPDLQPESEAQPEPFTSTIPQ